MTKTRISIAAAAALITVTAVFVATRDSGDEHATGQAPTTATATTTAAPGAGGQFDNPTFDWLGRKVVVPFNPAGVMLAQREPSTPRTECNTGNAAVTAPEGVQIQRTFHVPTLLSASDGPSRIDGTTPVGYRRSPQGAALAAWNYFIRLTVTGEQQRDFMLKLGVITDAERNKVMSAEVKEPTAEAIRTLHGMTAPEAFRVLSCDSDTMFIEFANRTDLAKDGKPLANHQWAGRRLHLQWREGDWKVPMVDSQGVGSGQTYPSLDDSWTRWTIS
ncbi:hypothetical protein ACIGO9_30715 [Nocardia asteroides]|uniref:hypothetical protein n=1 Tax=Nocardia asteroides TaxID=1824 RepID=UPI0037C77438